jgi:hypothetical protein
MADAPERALTSDFDINQVFASPHIVGLWGFKPVSQKKKYTCGAAAAVAVLRYHGHQSNEAQAAESMGTNVAVGTRPEALIKFFRKRGFASQGFTETPTDVIIERIQAGKITLVDWNDWGGHWVVAVGWEPRMQALVFADPARPKSNFACFSLEHFTEQWHCAAFEEDRKRLAGLSVMVDVPSNIAKKPNPDADIRVRSYSHKVAARENWRRKHGDPK